MSENAEMVMNPLLYGFVAVSPEERGVDPEDIILELGEGPDATIQITNANTTKKTKADDIDYNHPVFKGNTNWDGDKRIPTVDLGDLMLEQDAITRS